MAISAKDLFKVKSLGFCWAFRRRYAGQVRIKRSKTTT